MEKTEKQILNDIIEETAKNYITLPAGTYAYRCNHERHGWACVALYTLYCREELNIKRLNQPLRDRR